jgi:nitroreductase
MDGLEMLYTRRSVRSFIDKPVADEQIEKIVKAGKLAATARDVQPWEIIVVKNSKTRKRIADTTDHGQFIAEAPVCVAVFCEDSKYYLEDGSAATENILLAARYFGLGTCWVAGDKKPYAEEMVRLCQAKTGSRLVALIALGYPKDPNVFREKPLKTEGFSVI